eukprot:TRINITY_DN198_c0_g1_i3.p1 TRINITY_DN198_c0_g1~~TRINITY_DN198_c0_g1_i3.p1  ORF type:complete len:507 (-),score=68.98 TRINITY_DN198_c0_g1_i3:156-1538(-)
MDSLMREPILPKRIEAPEPSRPRGSPSASVAPAKIDQLASRPAPTNRTCIPTGGQRASRTDVGEDGFSRRRWDDPDSADSRSQRPRETLPPENPPSPEADADRKSWTTSASYAEEERSEDWEPPSSGRSMQSLYKRTALSLATGVKNFVETWREADEGMQLWLIRLMSHWCVEGEDDLLKAFGSIFELGDHPSPPPSPQPKPVLQSVVIPCKPKFPESPALRPQHQEMINCKPQAPLPPRLGRSRWLSRESFAPDPRFGLKEFWPEWNVIEDNFEDCMGSPKNLYGGEKEDELQADLYKARKEILELKAYKDRLQTVTKKNNKLQGQVEKLKERLAEQQPARGRVLPSPTRMRKKRQSEPSKPEALTPRKREPFRSRKVESTLGDPSHRAHPGTRDERRRDRGSSKETKKRRRGERFERGGISRGGTPPPNEFWNPRTSPRDRKRRRAPIGGGRNASYRS